VDSCIADCTPALPGAWPRPGWLTSDPRPTWTQPKKKPRNQNVLTPGPYVVGATGFDPATTCPRYLKAIGDPRTVVSDPEARYFGGRIGFDEWLRRSQARA
jgi:hypothetical protein